MQCYLKSLLRHAIDGVALHEEEGGDYLLQYVHVKDVAQACILAAQVPVERLKQRVFNVTAGEQESYLDEGLTSYADWLAEHSY
ncbi:hypothetical protein D3C85_1510740 [compost metagenome]